MEKTQPDQPWSEQDTGASQHLSNIWHSCDIVVGNGERMLFWTDRWLHDQSLSDLAPSLVTLVPKLSRRDFGVLAPLERM